jgi:hypothetical protein
MLKQAREILKAQDPELESFNDYPILLAEVLRAISYKETQAYEQMAMEQKIKAFGKQ